MCYPGAYSELDQTSKMERFTKIVNSFLAVNYFHKKLHFRYLRGLWIHLCHLRYKFSICISEKGTHTNKYGFSVSDFSDEDCIFAELKKCAWGCFMFFVLLWDLRPATLLKKGLWHRFFPVNFAKFLRATFSQNTSGRLLLNKPSQKIPEICETALS